MVGGIRLISILDLMYSRLTNEYFLKTGIRLDVPSFPNPSCTIKSQTTGQSHEVHTDGGDGDYGMGRILYSSIVCLNDDYEGGHTQFYLTGTMEKPNIDIDIKLKAGQALIFSADLNYHGVTEVTSGSRFSLIQFWRE
jgi:predicted 2-oxoglutarate/Fe(II)-dependent dioxygenase YbiX